MKGSLEAGRVASVSVWQHGELVGTGKVPAIDATAVFSVARVFIELIPKSYRDEDSMLKVEVGDRVFFHDRLDQFPLQEDASYIQFLVDWAAFVGFDGN